MGKFNLTEIMVQCSYRRTGVELWWSLYQSKSPLLSKTVLLNLGEQEELPHKTDIAFNLSVICAGFHLISTSSKRRNEREKAFKRIIIKEFEFGTTFLGGIYRAELVSIQRESSGREKRIACLQVYEEKGDNEDSTENLIVSVKLLPENGSLKTSDLVGLTDKVGNDLSTKLDTRQATVLQILAGHCLLAMEKDIDNA